MNAAQRLTESTKAERAALLSAGMAEISWSEWLARLGRYGYRLNRDCCFSYVNSYNGRAYRARSVSYADIETGLSYAHFQRRRDSRFRELQEMRFGCFVFHNGRIFEL